MPPNNMKGRLPRSSSPGKLLIYRFPEAEVVRDLRIFAGNDQDSNFDTYAEPATDRVGRRLAMPSVIRLIFDATEYDSTPTPTLLTFGYVYDQLGSGDFDYFGEYGSALGMSPPIGVLPVEIYGYDYYDDDTQTTIFYDVASPPSPPPPFTSYYFDDFGDAYQGDVDDFNTSFPPLANGFLRSKVYIRLTLFDVFGNQVAYEGTAESAPFMVPTYVEDTL